MGMALGGILVYPTLVALMGGDPLYTLGAGTVFESNVYGDIFGIPLIMQNYSSTILLRSLSSGLPPRCTRPFLTRCPRL